MKRSRIALYIYTALLLQSCEFNCSVGKTDEKTGKAQQKVSRIKNEIKLEANKLKIEKAYLVFENGDPVPEGNVIDISKPVKVMVVIDSGWTVVNNKVKIGASEKVEVEGGKVLLDSEDLFAEGYPDGVSAEDAKYVSLTETITLNAPPPSMTTFNISFRIWDKAGEGSILGSYKLYSK